MKDKDLLKKIWDFCDEQQKQMTEDQELEYCQGSTTAYSNIQYMINKKCTKSNY